MKEQLRELTMAQFIDLSCGDTDVLLEKGEKVSAATLESVVKRILFEFHSIADEAGARWFISQSHRTMKTRIEEIVLKMCLNMMALGKFADTRRVLSELGINASGMSGSRLKAEVKSRLERARVELSRTGNNPAVETMDEGEIRTGFDRQTAAMMAHYKFQIDISTMKATVYAHLIARLNSEIKAQLAAAKKK